MMMDHDYVLKAVAKKRRNTKYCCVPQCRTYGAQGLSFHLFPKDVNMNEKWKIALGIGKPTSSGMRVCSRHFESSDYFRNNYKRQILFPYAIPSRNLPKRCYDKEVPLSKKRKTIARENRADIRHKKIASKEDLGVVIQNEKNYVKDGYEDNNLSDESCPHDVMTSSIQVNLVDYRKDRPGEEWSLADILCEKEPSESCTQVNFLPVWTDSESSDIYLLGLP